MIKAYKLENIHSFESFLFYKQAIQNGAQVTFNIWGRSMYPLFTGVGETVEVSPVLDKEELKRFDIIVFWQGDKLTIHYFWRYNRIFQSDEGNLYLTTRPLNPIRQFDHPISFNQILGKVKAPQMGVWLKLQVYFFTFMSKD